MSWEATAFSKNTRGHPNMSTRAVLLTLSDYHSHKLGYAFCSQATLAEDCECSVRNIRSALAFLEKAGWITQAKKGNQFQPSNWVFNFAAAPRYEPEVAAEPAADAQDYEPEESVQANSAGTPISSKVNRKDSVSEPEAPRHTNLKEPPLVTSIVKITMDTLEQVRGYVSTRYGAEAKAVKEMEGLGYTANDICECYESMKKDKFWKDKALTTMSIKSTIGEWKKNQKLAKPDAATINQQAKEWQEEGDRRRAEAKAKGIPI